MKSNEDEDRQLANASTWDATCFLTFLFEIFFLGCCYSWNYRYFRDTTLRAHCKMYKCWNIIIAKGNKTTTRNLFTNCGYVCWKNDDRKIRPWIITTDCECHNKGHDKHEMQSTKISCVFTIFKEFGLDKPLVNFCSQLLDEKHFRRVFHTLIIFKKKWSSKIALHRYSVTR